MIKKLLLSLFGAVAITTACAESESLEEKVAEALDNAKAIVFVKKGDIYVKEPGRAAIEITDDDLHKSRPVVLPSKEIVFAGNGSAYKTNIGTDNDPSLIFKRDGMRRIDSNFFVLDDDNIVIYEAGESTDLKILNMKSGKTRPFFDPDQYNLLDIRGYDLHIAGGDTSIVFSARPHGSGWNDSHQLDIYTYNLRDKKLQNITNNNSKDTHPVFSPDGTKVACYSDRKGSYNIHVLDSKTGNEELVVLAGGTGSRRISWSQDGNSLVYGVSSNLLGRGGVFEYLFDSKKVIPLDEIGGWASYVN